MYAQALSFKEQCCFAIRLPSLSGDLDINEEKVNKLIRSSKVGDYNVNKDFLMPSKNDNFVKRGVNSISLRSTVIWTASIHPDLVAKIENCKISTLMLGYISGY